MSPADIEWVFRYRPLGHDGQQLVHDYGKDEAAAMLEAFADPALAGLAAALAWPGVATRWRAFVNWLRDEGHRDRRVGVDDPRAALCGFAAHLGSVRTHRALALTDEQYRRVVEADTIVAKGMLRADGDAVAAFLRERGLRSVIHDRIYDFTSLYLDPSLSLHDDPETATWIACHQLRERQRVYLFDLEVPAIEVLGWRMCDVDGESSWFNYYGIWFDNADFRTERFALFEIPMLSRRLRGTRTFSSLEEIDAFVQPFRTRQEQRHARCERMDRGI